MKRPPPAIVVDASVLAKALLEEPGRDEVLRGLRKATEAGVALLVPPHARAEVGNALLRAARLAGRTAEEVEQALLDALVLVDVAGDPPGVAAEAFSHGLTFYDATYLALTKSTRGARLWTYDGKLGAAADSESVRFDPSPARG